MLRPKIVCHMLTSLDGKVTGDFLSRPECAAATEIYYRINREKKCDGYMLGRVTMAESFTGGYYPDLTKYAPARHDPSPEIERILGGKKDFYAIAFDTLGRLGYTSNRIKDPDGDEGYDGARILPVLSEQADERYLGYLEAMEIPYIIAGKKKIDLPLALFKLYALFGCRRLLLEGGSRINGAFLRAGLVDEISLVVAPTVADKKSKPLFYGAALSDFTLENCETERGNLILNYQRKEKETDNGI